MRFLLQLPVVRVLHAQGLLLLALLIPVVGGVLLHGALESRDADSQAAAAQQPAPTLAPLLTFRPNLEKTPLTYLSDYWLQLGQRVEEKLVLIGRDGTPAIVVGPGLAVTSIVAADDVEREARRLRALREHVAASAEVAESDGEPESEGAVPDPGEAGAETRTETTPGSPAVEPGSPDPYRLLGTDTFLEVALFAVEPPAAQVPFSVIDPSQLHAGSFVVAVTLSGDEQLRVAPGHLVANRSAIPESVIPQLDVSLTIPPSVRAAAIVDLDGNLVGTAIRSRDGMRFLPASYVLELVERLQADQSCHTIEVTEVSDAVRELLSIGGGVIVERVQPEAFVPEPSILAGDVLLEWAQEPISDAPTFYARYEEQVPGSLVRYVVLRGRRRLSGGTRMPGPDCRPVGEPATGFPAVGVTLLWSGGESAAPGVPAPGWRVVAVAPESPAATAGVEVDDWILGIDRRAADGELVRQQFERFATRPRSMLLKIWRAGRITLVAVLPDPA